MELAHKSKSLRKTFGDYDSLIDMKKIALKAKFYLVFLIGKQRNLNVYFSVYSRCSQLPFSTGASVGKKDLRLIEMLYSSYYWHGFRSFNPIKKYNNKPYEKLVAMKDNSSREFPLLQAELRNKAAILKFNVITTCTNFGPLIGWARFDLIQTVRKVEIEGR